MILTFFMKNTIKNQSLGSLTTSHMYYTYYRYRHGIMAKKKAKEEESLEKKLWKAAEKLRKNIVLGLMFLKHISDSFDELYNKLSQKW